MMKSIRVRTGLTAAMLLLAASGAHAASNNGGISLSGTRLIFDGSNDAASMTVTNSAASDVWLMRFWVSAYGDKADVKANIPFAVTPPLYRLDPQNAVQLRVNKLSDSLPTDRESVFYLNNLAIPPKRGEKSYQKAVQSGLQFAVNTRIKLFYRPEAISNADAVKAAPGNLTLSMSGDSMTLKNPSPYFITLARLSVNGKVVQASGDGMVSPFGSVSVAAGAAHGTLAYSFVDDRGMTVAAPPKTF